MRILVIGGLLGVGALWAHTEQFIIKKSDVQEKKKSISNLREECCELSGDIIEGIPGLLHDIADLQHVAAHMVAGYVQDDKKSFCQKASKEQLISCIDELRELQERLDAIQAEISASVKKLKFTVFPAKSIS